MNTPAARSDTQEGVLPSIGVLSVPSIEVVSSFCCSLFCVVLRKRGHVLLNLSVPWVHPVDSQDYEVVEDISLQKGLRRHPV